MIEGQRIEEESFRIIQERIEGVPYPESEVVKRVIHSTADFEFAKLLHFKNNPIESAIEAIEAGRDIISDVKMVRVGISGKLGGFGGRPLCFIDSMETKDYSERHQVTRARASFRVHRKKLGGQVIAVGNAPTALFELMKLMDEGIEPAAVIGVPVGFVGAAEAKEELLGCNIPSITVKGAKGGSTIAAAIANAIIKLAGEK